MMRAAIFHLAFPVASVAASLDFYARAFAAAPGRRTATWCDLVLFGHQLTLHEQPGQVLPREQRGVRHFGAILGWDELAAIRTRVEAMTPAPAATWSLRDAGLPSEHAKLLVEDPDGYLIEVKAYRTLATIAGKLG